MQRYINIVFIILLVLNIFFAAWSVANGDIVFSSDIARDFHIFREIDQKKFILIGPRSSGTLYHGPFWPYLNYPAYVIGKGNPIVVGWWWVILISLFIFSCYFIAKALFNRSVAIVFTLMTSLYMSYHAREMINSHGAMLLLPAFFFFFVRYAKKKKYIYLVAHMVIGASMIQFSLSNGIPYVICSVLAIIWLIVKTRKWRHLFALLIIPLMLSNFIIFDIRHQHILLNNLKDFVLPFQNNQLFDYTSIVSNRIKLMFTGVELLHNDVGYRNAGLFAIFLIFIYVQRKDKKYPLIYVSFLYFYIGFFITSMVNKGFMLYFHFFPIFPLVFLVFSSFITSRYKRAFIVLFIILYLLNIQAAVNDMKAMYSFSGKDPVSWKFLSTVARYVYNDSKDEFGYFVFAPDGFGYGLKYAMLYEASRSSAKSYYFQKKPITYLVAVPHIFFQHTWWRENSINIKKLPETTQVLGNGYIVERYNLTDAETRVTFDPAIDLGLTFR